MNAIIAALAFQNVMQIEFAVTVNYVRQSDLYTMISEEKRVNRGSLHRREPNRNKKKSS